MGAIAAGLIIGGASVAVGAYQNNKAAKANETAQDLSRADYATRLKAAAEGAKALEKQYNEIVSDRPDLTWESFVRDKITSINDPWLREFYTNAKTEDFEKLRQFAQRSTLDNVDNLKSVADELSGGRWQEITDKRNELVLNTDAAGRMARAYELAAPVMGGASTVRYDNKGQLIESQRAGAQAFNVAQEVQTAVEQEQKADLRTLETDRLSAAQSQVDRAKEFMPFFDATGYATAAESDRSKLVHGYVQGDEERAFDIYKLFATASTGIQPVQPTYQDVGVGNQLISSGVSTASSSLSNYGNATKKPAGTY